MTSLFGTTLPYIFFLREDHIFFEIPAIYEVVTKDINNRFYWYDLAIFFSTSVKINFYISTASNLFLSEKALKAFFNFASKKLFIFYFFNSFFYIILKLRKSLLSHNIYCYLYGQVVLQSYISGLISNYICNRCFAY